MSANYRCYFRNRINQKLEELFESSVINNWWKTPNNAFNGMVPEDLLNTTEGIKRLNHTLFKLKLGLPKI